MKCNTRTMVATGGALVAILAIAYVVFPPVRALVLGVGPYLLILLCPLMMWLMMKQSNDRARPSRPIVIAFECLPRALGLYI